MAQTQRRRMGYWDPFNNWWREYVKQHDKRPKVNDMKRWYDANAESAWGGTGPTWEETKKHSKGMRRIEEVSEYFREYRKGRKRRAGLLPDTSSSESETDTETPSSNGAPSKNGKRKVKASRKDSLATVADSPLPAPQTRAASTSQVPQAPPSPSQGFGLPLPNLQDWFPRAVSMPDLPDPVLQRRPRRRAAERFVAPEPPMLQLPSSLLEQPQQLPQQQLPLPLPLPQHPPPQQQQQALPLSLPPQQQQQALPLLPLPLPHQHQQHRQQQHQHQHYHHQQPMDSHAAGPSISSEASPQGPFGPVATAAAVVGPYGAGPGMALQAPSAKPTGFFGPFRQYYRALSWGRTTQPQPQLQHPPPQADDMLNNMGAAHPRPNFGQHPQSQPQPQPQQRNTYGEPYALRRSMALGSGSAYQFRGVCGQDPAAAAAAAPLGMVSAADASMGVDAACGGGVGPGVDRGRSGRGYLVTLTEEEPESEAAPAPAHAECAPGVPSGSGGGGGGDVAMAAGYGAHGSSPGGGNAAPGILDGSGSGGSGDPSSGSGSRSFNGLTLFRRGSTLRRVQSLFNRWAAPDTPEGANSPDLSSRDVCLSPRSAGLAAGVVDVASDPHGPGSAGAALGAAAGPSRPTISDGGGLDPQQLASRQQQQQQGYQGYYQQLVGRWTGLLRWGSGGWEGPNPFQQQQASGSPIISQNGSGQSPGSWLLGRRSRESCGSPTVGGSSPTAAGRRLQRGFSLTASPNRVLQRGLSDVLRPLWSMMSLGRRDSEATAAAAAAALAAVGGLAPEETPPADDGAAGMRGASVVAGTALTGGAGGGGYHSGMAAGGAGLDAHPQPLPLPQSRGLGAAGQRDALAPGPAAAPPPPAGPLAGSGPMDTGGPGAGDMAFVQPGLQRQHPLTRSGAAAGTLMQPGFEPRYADSAMQPGPAPVQPPTQTLLPMGHGRMPQGLAGPPSGSHPAHLARAVVTLAAGPGPSCGPFQGGEAGPGLDPAVGQPFGRGRPVVTTGGPGADRLSQARVLPRPLSHPAPQGGPVFGPGAAYAGDLSNSDSAGGTPQYSDFGVQQQQHLQQQQQHLQQQQQQQQQHLQQQQQQQHLQQRPMVGQQESYAGLQQHLQHAHQQLLGRGEVPPSQLLPGAPAVWSADRGSLRTVGLQQLLFEGDSVEGMDMVDQAGAARGVSGGAGGVPPVHQLLPDGVGGGGGGSVHGGDMMMDLDGSGGGGGGQQGYAQEAPDRSPGGSLLLRLSNSFNDYLRRQLGWVGR